MMPPLPWLTAIRQRLVAGQHIADEDIHRLLALLRGKEPKRWCGHILWRDDHWKLESHDEGYDYNCGHVYADWTVCPLCATPRPAGT